jgi:LDH2 family malate/lactate/ureidoglycolate dehydrogenase
MKITVLVSELRSIMAEIFRVRNIPDEYATFIIDDYIEAELEGHSSHGVVKLLLLDSALKKKTGSPVVTQKQGNYAKIDGNKDLGHISGLLAVKTAIELARVNMNSLVALTNTSRYSRIKPFARMISEAGLVGIIVNNGGPAAVTPYGSSTPIFGTNPICFSFPSVDNGNPYIFDFSTSEKVWAEIRQSILGSRPLPSDCFLDKNGKFTTDPNSAEAVIPFGKAKGYALCYAIEILTGAFVSGKMGLATVDEYDLGFLFLALSPTMFTTLDEFTKSIAVLADEVKNASPLEEGNRVFIPGQRSQELLIGNSDKGSIELDKSVFESLKLMSVSSDGGMESNSRIN